MRYLFSFTAGFLLMVAQGAAWAQIYETRDAEGHPVFSDVPVDANSNTVEVQKTNISDSPPPTPDDEAPAATPADQQAPHVARTRVFNDPNAAQYEEHERRVLEEQREAMDGAERHETLDGAERHETMGGAERHETMDGAKRHETEGGAERHETMDGAERHETEGGSARREVGDF